MKKPTFEQVAKFLLLSLPAYWTLSLLFIALAVWRSPFAGDFIWVALISIAVITAAFFLMKNHYWVCIPMGILGVYIALLDDQFAAQLFQFYGIYLIVHYAACGVYAYKQRKRRSPT